MLILLFNALLHFTDLLTDEELGEIATRLIIQTTSKLVLLAAELGQTKEVVYNQLMISENAADKVYIPL